MKMSLFSHWAMSDPFVTPMGCSLPASSIHGVLDTGGKNTEWVAFSFSRGSFQLRDQTQVSCIGRWILYHWDMWEAYAWWIYMHANWQVRWEVSGVLFWWSYFPCEVGDYDIGCEEEGSGRVRDFMEVKINGILTMEAWNRVKARQWSARHGRMCGSQRDTKMSTEDPVWTGNHGFVMPLILKFLHFFFPLDLFNIPCVTVENSDNLNFPELWFLPIEYSGRMKSQPTDVYVKSHL